MNMLRDQIVMDVARDYLHALFDGWSPIPVVKVLDRADAVVPREMRDLGGIVVEFTPGAHNIELKIEGFREELDRMTDAIALQGGVPYRMNANGVFEELGMME